MSQVSIKKKSARRPNPRLDGRNRIGRKARNIAWDQGGSFVRRAWLPLLGAFSIPFLSSLAFAAWWLKGSERWVFLGISGTSCVWLVILIVVLWSGIGPTIMGIEGEGMTSDTLRSFKKEGWTLINGMRFPDSGDIDHILVGPPGIFIFETKWSSARWPMNGERWPYITNQLNWAMSQVKKNQDDISKRIIKAHRHIPIYAVCVLWSAADSSGDPTSFQAKSPEYVFCVRGKALDAWLKEPRRNVLSIEEVKTIASELSQMAIASDIESNDSYKRTLSQIMLDSVILPIFGFVAPLWIESIAAVAKNAYLDFGTLLALLVFGIYLRMRTRLQAVVVCWFVSLGMMAAYLLAHEIPSLLRRN